MYVCMYALFLVFYLQRLRTRKQGGARRSEGWRSSCNCNASILDFAICFGPTWWIMFPCMRRGQYGDKPGLGQWIRCFCNLMAFQILGHRTSFSIPCWLSLTAKQGSLHSKTQRGNRWQRQQTHPSTMPLISLFLLLQGSLATILCVYEFHPTLGICVDYGYLDRMALSIPFLFPF